MGLYKVLLVDDEEDVRQTIARKLDWQQLGFCLIGEADNGEDALEMVEQLEPDVVMTDIKMPFMDGLTLCKKAKQILPGIKVAVFSGFDEFEYAKEAISLEVEEYILKPVDAAELSRVFTRIRENLDREVAESRDMQRLRQYYQDSLPLMHQQLLSAVLSGQFDQNKISTQLAEFGLDLQADSYCVAVIQFERNPKNQSALSEEEKLVSFSLPQLIETVLKSNYSYEILRHPDSIEVLFLLKQDELPQTLVPHMNRLLTAAKKRLDIRLGVGIGQGVTRLTDIFTSRQQAQDALGYQVLSGECQSVYIGDIFPNTDYTEIWDTQYIEEIMRQIKVGDTDGLNLAVQQLVRQFKKAAPSLQEFQFFMLSMSAELLRLVRAYQLDEEDKDLGTILLEKLEFRFSSLDEMGHWLFDYCEKLRKSIRHERKDTTRTMVEKAKAYLLENYNKSDLSIEELSNELNVSPAYFSTLFKKETGEAFVAYLTGLRMEKALEYLNTTDDKTYTIAERIGYLDPNYFSYVFKKQYGVSPSKYRSNKKVGHETS